jgi:hypothetical protein
MSIGTIGKLEGAQVEPGNELATAPVNAGGRNLSADVCEFDRRGQLVNFNNAGLAAYAGVLSRSGCVPKQFADKPNDCFVACCQAAILGIAPLTYMQNSSVVHGKPAPDGKLYAALLIRSGLIRGRIKYELKYATRGGKQVAIACTASVIDRESGEVLTATIDEDMVKGEGWGAKWKTMPEQMFCYRSAAFLTRRHFPELAVGIGPTADEIEDDPSIIEGEAVPNAEPQTAIERMRAIGSEPEETADPASEPEAESSSGVSAEEEAEILADIARQSGELFPNADRPSYR